MRLIVARSGKRAGGKARSTGPGPTSSGSSAAALPGPLGSGNVNDDWWHFEHRPDTLARESSADGIDHFHRYAEDFALLKSLGNNAPAVAGMVAHRAGAG
jgi:hypothetical protein